MKKYIFLAILSIFFLSCSENQTEPIYDYYKNIPVLRGWTNDIYKVNYMIEVVLVYREGNNDLQTKINLLKPTFIDALRAYYSSLKEIDFVIENQLTIKSTSVKLLNELILDSMIPKKADILRKIDDPLEKDLILDVNIMQLQLFPMD
ncbi:MAG: hypothetical protein OCD02_19170 [Spirochaetaceae bacterium]